MDVCFSKQFQDMTDIHRRRKWEVISDVWVEMLAFVAHNCEWKEHVQQLRKGGELITHVYRVMSHFGFCREYTGHKLMQLTSPSLQEETVFSK